MRGIIFCVIGMLFFFGCAIPGYDVHVDKKLSDHVFLGEQSGQVGIWMHKDVCDSNGVFHHSGFIFSNPDTILVVTNEYILAKRKRKYCLIYLDSNEYFGNYIITKDTLKIMQFTTPISEGTNPTIPQQNLTNIGTPL